MKLASIIHRYCLQHPTLTPVYLSVPRIIIHITYTIGTDSIIDPHVYTINVRNVHSERISVERKCLVNLTLMTGKDVLPLGKGSKKNSEKV